MKRLPSQFFNPRSIVVVGATKKGGFGSGIPRMLKMLGYGDRLYLVNPREKEMEGLAVYRRVTDIAEPIDLAIIIVPRNQVKAVLEDCLSKGIKAVILESAGFGETGLEGARLEDELRELVKNSDVRVIGPNCVGLINPHGKFASTEVAMEKMTPGNIGVIAQSGVFGNIVADWSPSQDMHVSSLVTIGNRIDVDEVDLLHHFADDDKTDVIVLYLEGAKDGKKFQEAAREVSFRKPVIAYKSGRTEVGKKAAASHTGSMSGSDGIYDGVLRQSGIIRANGVQELFDLARVFASQPLMTGCEIGVVTLSGSLGVMAADAAFHLGLSLPDLSADTVGALREPAPPWMNIKNPLDPGPSGLFGIGLEAVLQDPGIRGVIAIPVMPASIVESLIEQGVEPEVLLGDPGKIRRTLPGKPVVTCTIGSDFWISLIRKMFGPYMTVVSSPETATKALWALHRYHRFRQEAPL